MTFQPAGFAEDTDFERLVIGLLGTHRVRPAAPGAIYDARGKPRGGNITVRVGTADSFGNRVEDLKESLRPVGFGARLQDLGHAHRARFAGLRSFGRPPQLQDEGSQPRIPSEHAPRSFDTRPELWDRLASLYTTFQEARHAVTHRRAQATQTGDLEIHDERRQVIDTVARDEIKSFAAAIHAVAELVIDASTDPRRLNIGAWHLNHLQTRHGAGRLSATDPEAGTRLLRADLLREGDRLRSDASHAREIMASQPPSLWDLELHVSDRKFVGRWDDVPDREQEFYDFYPGSPPSWLTEEVGAP